VGAEEGSVAVRILTIEDSPSGPELAARALRGLPTPSGPVELLWVVGWQQALPAIEAGGLDLMLLDFHLPGLSGLDILHELEHRAHPPVIMLTGQDDLATVVETLHAGARDYVPKSADWDVALPLAVERVLERVRLEEQLADSRARLAAYALELEGKVATRTAVVQAQAGEIEKLYLKAEEATRLKEDFLANVSHEFRTPLNGVLGFAEVLQDELAETASPEVRDMLHSLRTQGKRLLQLVESVLTLRQLKHGHEAFVRSRFTLTSLIEELRADAIPMQGDTGLALEWKALTETCEVEHDREKIRVIAYHLLSNALKFTHHGRVETALAAAPDGAIVLTVSDTGIGFPPEARETIFEDFRQLDGSRTRRYQGLGLGLGIVKRYTALLRGTVRVRSVEGMGTTITVELPALPPVDLRSEGDRP